MDTQFSSINSSTLELEHILIGQADTHVTDWPGGACMVNKQMVADLNSLKQAAAEAGFELRVASAFRTFKAQLTLWNAKANGQRHVLDEAGNPIDLRPLSPEQKLAKLLRWSALPGASRHHWGTDLDVYDAAALPILQHNSALPSRYTVKLTLRESQTIFGRFHGWLTENMGRCGFFRPYAEDLGGVGMEPWHLSYAPVAEPYFDSFQLEPLERALRASEIELKEEILEALPEIFEKYIRNISRF